MAQHPIPDRQHLASLVADLQRHGSQTAVKSRRGVRHGSISYAGLAELAGRCAHYLESRAIRKSDRVVIWGDNTAEWLAAFFGCILRGVVAVPVDVAGSAEFAQRVVREVSPKLILGDAAQLGMLDGGTPSIAFSDFDRELPQSPLLEPADGLAESDILQIVFTSGTTGEPKGVVHTHANVLASLRPIEREIHKYLKYERVFHPLGFLHTLPLSHVFGQFMGIWIPVLLGAVVHFESKLIAGDLVDTIRRERVSVLAAVPRVIEMLGSHLKLRFPNLEQRMQAAKGLSVWRRWWMFRDVHRAVGLKFWALISGGATLGAEIEQFWGTLGFVVVQGYGMTETAALVSLNHPFRPARGTIGQVLPGREIRLSDEGEILVRGATVSGASWEQGALHARESEWLATGDLGALDEKGNLTFRGRKKEVIVTAAGLNIYPEDLEAALLKQPQIRAAAVVEASGPQGPQPLAALVMRGSDDPAEAVRSANRELAEYQQIRRWVLWPEPDLPRTSTGKVMRRQVAAAIQPAGGVAPAPQGGLAGILHRITGEDASRLPDSAVLAEDLHIDSLARVELQSAIETQFGVQVAEVGYQRARTLGDLKALISAPAPQTERAPNVYPQWPWTWMASAVRIAFLETIVRPLAWFLAAPRVERSNASPPKRPVLIVANHVTEYDVGLLLYALPPRIRRRAAVAMAGEMLRSLGLVRYLLATGLFNAFPLPQHGNFRASFAHAGRAMDRGFHVLVFPEGRRTPDAQMHKFQGGSGILWTQLGCEALPVYMEGLTELKTSGGRWFRSGRIKIRAGSMLTLPLDADPAAATALLERAVRDLARGSGPA